MFDGDVRPAEDHRRKDEPRIHTGVPRDAWMSGVTFQSVLLRV